MTPEDLIQRIAATPFTGRRRLVALAGPPASGKSTLAEALAALDPQAKVVPMDGFHLDNGLLEPLGLLPRKGAHQTFDAMGFQHLVRRLRNEDEVIYPLFDRTLDKSINAAGRLGPETETVVIEGNYLLLDKPVWRDLAGFWDISIHLRVAKAELERRLIQRWRDHGLTESDAVARAQSNDMINAELVQNQSLAADIIINHEPK